MRVGVFLIIYVISLSANLAFAGDYTDLLPLVQNSERVSSSRISEAKLLENYVLKYQQKINSLYASYSDTPSLAIENANIQLSDMASALERIQVRSVGERDSTKVMQGIIEDIKVLNIRMKVYLEQEDIIAQEKLKKQAENYILVGRKISSLLDIFIEKMTSTLIKKESLSTNDTNIIRSLVRIRDENTKIKAFGKKNFSSQEDMKLYFQAIIENIRKEIRTIKSLSSF